MVSLATLPKHKTVSLRGKQFGMLHPAFFTLLLFPRKPVFCFGKGKAQREREGERDEVDGDRTGKMISEVGKGRRSSSLQEELGRQVKSSSAQRQRQRHQRSGAAARRTSLTKEFWKIIEIYYDKTVAV